MSVPFPTPDGPVMTKTRATSRSYDASPAEPDEGSGVSPPSGPLRGRSRRSAWALAAQQRDELGALTLRKPADRLAGRDPTLLQDLVGLHAAVLRDRQEHVEDLRGLHVLRRLREQHVDRHPAPLQVLLELRPTCPNLVGALERVHALKKRSLGCRRVLGRRVGSRRHRSAILQRATPLASGKRRI